MQIKRIKPRTDYYIPELISEIKSGLLRIPRFQRDYVWPRTKVVKLLDSIYNEYPIGSFFIWDAPKKYNYFYRNVADLNTPEPDSFSNINFILDGQQRIVSIYVAIKGLTVNKVDYSRIYFNLEIEKFYIPPRGVPKEGKYVQFCKMLSENLQLRIYDGLDDKYKNNFQKCRNKFNNYPLSAVYIRDADLNEVVEMFERVNRGGKPLTLFDLVVAGTWAEDFDLKEKTSKLNKFFIDKGFGKINPDNITQTLSLILKNNCTNSAQLQMKTKEIKDIWEKISDSFKMSVDFVSDNLGVRIHDFIPYPAMLSLIAYLFFKTGNRALDANQTNYVKKWFWRAAFSERYGSATLTRMNEDKKKIFDFIYEGNSPEIKFPIVVNPDGLRKIVMYRKSAVKNAVLCILALQRPRHFKNSNLIVLDKNICADVNNSERHHIFPRAFIKREMKDKNPDLLMNFCFIPAELNKEILDKNPADYIKRYQEENPDFNEVLKSHLIPGTDYLLDDAYENFIEARIGLIDEIIKRYIGEDDKKESGIFLEKKD